MTRGDLERPLDLCLFLIAEFIIIIVIIIFIHVRYVWKRSCVVFLRMIEGTVALTQSTHIIIHITYTRVVFDGLRRCRFSPSRFIDPLSSSSSQQYIIIICDASAQRTWLARAFPKYPRGSQNPFLFTIVSILLLPRIK